MRKLFAVILSLGLIIAPVPVVSTAHAAGGAGGYAKIVLGMANGIIGSTILEKCKLGAQQPSLVLYLAGSLTYVAAEVLGGKAKRSSVDGSAQSLDQLKATMTEGGDYQKAAVQAQIDNEKSNLKHIQTKRKWMMATKAIYTAAAALAIVEFILSLPPPPAGPGILKPDMGACAPSPSHKPVEKGIVLAYMAAQGYANGGLMGAGLAVATPYLMEFLGLMEVGSTVTDLAVPVLNSALGRAAAFTAAAALVMTIDAELTKEEKRSKKIIADLEKVKAQFLGSDNALAEGSSTSNSQMEAGGAEVNTDSKKQYAIKPLENAGKVAKHCYSNTSQGLEYSETGCKTPIKLSKPNIQSTFDIPTLKAAANSSIEMAQAVAKGDLGRADIQAGNLTSMASKLDAVNADLMKKANDLLKKQGKKPIDIDGELQRQVTQLNDALNKKKPGSGNITLADVKGSGDIGSSDIGKAEVSKASDIDKASDVSASNPDAVAIGTDGIGASDSSDGANGMSDGSSLIGEDAEAIAGESANLASLKGSSFDRFHSSTNGGEISNDPDSSLFKQVSNRYFLNYTRLFKRKQITPPAVPEQTVK